jgi:hypothetical protein
VHDEPCIFQDRPGFTHGRGVRQRGHNNLFVLSAHDQRRRYYRNQQRSSQKDDPVTPP